MLIDQTHIILDSDSTEAALYLAVQTLHERWSAVSKIRGDNLEPWFDQDNFLEDGLAVSPGIAALCWLDTARSVTFLRGVKAAIDHALRTINERPLELVYAGCGPFAALITPLLPLYRPDDLQVTLLDANEPSITSVQTLFEQEGVTPFLNAAICCDATRYTHPQSIHLLVSETMQAALHQEPQVAITLNLVPQLHEQGILIPEQIQVDAVLSHSGDEDVERQYQRNDYGFRRHRLEKIDQKRIQLGTLMRLDKSTRLSVCERPVLIRMAESNPKTDLFLLVTQITVFNGWKFIDYDCQLTFPQRIFELAGEKEGSEIEFVYEMGQTPHFTHKTVAC